MNKIITALKGWKFISATAGKYLDPSELSHQEISWKEAIVPGTVAKSLGLPTSAQINLDLDDWWYHCPFPAAEAKPGTRAHLHFEGLATLCEVWLNDEPILNSSNMFIGHVCDVTHLLKDQNEIYIRFRSLDQEIKIKKPRPRWKTNLVNHQNLRFIRTTILGRIPLWSPSISAIGPWKDISLQIIEETSIDVKILQTNVEGSTGILRFSADVQYFGNERIRSATLYLEDKSFSLSIEKNENSAKIFSEIQIEKIALWWPHTHGDPVLHSCRVELEIDNRMILIDCGRIGFKSIFINRDNDLVQFQINGEAIFCRGACWTLNDFITLIGTQSDLLKILTLAKEGGINMFRICGTFAYEIDEFYRLCDELGILVWQGFMFVSMDYPVNDPEFRIEIENEITYQLNRLQKYICLAAYCGGADLQQRPAMMGLPKEDWSNAFFDQVIPEMIKKLHPQIPYFPSSPFDGSFPFHLSKGITHYYGVGAYRRDLSEVKYAKIKFTSECLGFSSIPDDETLQLMDKGSIPAPHSAIWKSRVPKEYGAGWDFDDVRDFYLKLLFKIDPVDLRFQDIARYLQLSKVVPGEVMKRVFSEWRKQSNPCSGALVWFFKDFWPAASFGIIDSEGIPKAVWYDLKRVWANQALLITDEGLDGLEIQLVNETQKPLKGILGLELFTNQKTRTGNAVEAVEIPRRGSLTFQADSLLGYFSDVTVSYQFGPPKYDVVWSYLKCPETNRIISESFYFPIGLNLPYQDLESIQLSASFINEKEVVLILVCPHFLQSVHFSSPGFTCDDNYFHLAPDQVKTIKFVSTKEKIRQQFKVEFSAINLRESITVRATFERK